MSRVHAGFALIVNLVVRLYAHLVYLSANVRARSSVKTLWVWLLHTFRWYLIISDLRRLAPLHLSLATLAKPWFVRSFNFLTDQRHERFAGWIKTLWLFFSMVLLSCFAWVFHPEGLIIMLLYSKWTLTITLNWLSDLIDLKRTCIFESALLCLLTILGRLDDLRRQISGRFYLKLPLSICVARVLSSASLSCPLAVHRSSNSKSERSAFCKVRPF